jgi:CheY-like chemotaxis protein
VLAIANTESRARYAYALFASGFDVVAADNPIAWCATADSGPPDIIVADVATTSHGGWTVVQRFKSEPRTRDVPLVALCDDTGDRTRERARREGCAAVCVNTCSEDLIARGLRAVLRQADRDL